MAPFVEAQCLAPQSTVQITYDGPSQLKCKATFENISAFPAKTAGILEMFTS